jgi:hypothetical protein
LADANRFHEDDIETSGLTQQDGLARRPRNAAQRPRRWRGPDEGGGFCGKARHSRFVAQNGASRTARRWIDGKHGDTVAFGGEETSERIDERGLANSRHASDADPKGKSCGSVELREQNACGGSMLALSTFDKRYRLGKSDAIACEDKPGQPFRSRTVYT